MLALANQKNANSLNKPSKNVQKRPKTVRLGELKKDRFTVNRLKRLKTVRLGEKKDQFIRFAKAKF